MLETSSHPTADLPPGPEISRRRLLALAGGAASVLAVEPWAFALVNGRVVQEPASVDANWRPVLFSRAQGLAVARLSEAIIPRTDTSGAIDAKVAEFIDLSLSLEPEAAQGRFLSGLKAFDASVRRRAGKRMPKVSDQQLRDVLSAVSDAHAEHPIDLLEAAKFFANLKQRVVFAYYTSLEGRTEELGLPARVQRVGYNGCADQAAASVGN